LSDSGILVLGPRTWQQARESCLKLGENLWGAKSNPRDIQSDLNYLVYQGKYPQSQHFWTASDHRKPSTINANGQIKSAKANKKLPVICTQTAPYSNITFQDTSAKWQVTVNSNNEYLTG
jgi:hypothetical protein